MNRISSVVRKHQWLGYLVAAIILAIVLRPPMNHLGHDVGIYTLCGQEMLQGKVIYRDIWDNKGPVVYLVYALIVDLVGTNAVAINIVAILYLLLVAGAIWLVTNHISGRSSAMIAFFAMLLGAVFPMGQQLNGELIMELFIVLGLLALLRGLKGPSRLLLVLGGAGIGVALQTKGIALLDGAALTSLLVLWPSPEERCALRERVVRLLWLAVGIAVPTAGIVAYFAYHGAVADFITHSILDNLRYIEASPDGSFTHQLLVSIESTVLPAAGFWIGAVLGAFVVLQTVVCCAGRQSQPDSQRTRAVGIMLLVWLVLTFVGVMTGRRFFSHYYVQMLPVASILAGVGIGKLLREMRSFGNWLPWAVLATMGVFVCLSLLPRFGSALYKWRGLWGGPVHLLEGEEVGLWLGHEVHPGEKMFVWPCTAYPYLYSGAEPAGRFFSHWYNPWPPEQKRGDPYQRKLYQVWERDMVAAQAEWIALGRKTGADPRQWPPERRFLAQWLRPDYVWYAEVADYDIYRRAGRR